MAKIITVQLLLASDSEIEIESFIKNELDQLIAATNGMIIDGKVAGANAEPSPEVLEALRTGNYTEGKAFDHENASARRLLIMDGDVSPYIIGPFDSEDLRLETVFVSREQAKSSFSERDWTKARKEGATNENFEAWAETMASSLPTAKDVLSGIVDHT